ncbi:MAG: hypothetical protein QNL33_15890 [Akkermansiaceae bacterium]
MSTTLRPLIGRSDSFFTSGKRFFLEHWGLTFSDAPITESKDSKGQPTTPTNPQTKPQGASQTNPFLDE